MNPIHGPTAFAAGCLVLLAALLGQEPADRILYGGPVITIDDKAIRAEAVAEKDGKIIAIGSKASVMKLKGPSTQIVDVHGRTVLVSGSNAVVQ